MRSPEDNSYTGYRGLMLHVSVSDYDDDEAEAVLHWIGLARW